MFTPLKLNQGYFYDETPSRFYVLGAFYASYVPQKSRDVVFRSSHRKLVEMVKSELRAEHKIHKDPRRESYNLEFRYTPMLRHSLEQLGLSKEKTAREFPVIYDHQYMANFVRGFMDAQAIVKRRGDSRIGLSMTFGRPFLCGMQAALHQYARLDTCKFPLSMNRSYGHADTVRIGNFLYEGLGRQLYLPEKKEVFKPFLTERNEEQRQRVNEVRQLARCGLGVEDIVFRLHYPHVSSLEHEFVGCTGMTLRQYLHDHKVRDYTGLRRPSPLS